MKRAPLNLLLLVGVLVIGIGIGVLISTPGTSGAEVNQEVNDFSDYLTPEKKAEIQQVLPMEDGAVAALYTDGAVRVSGNARYAEATENWSSVVQLYHYKNSIWEAGEFHDKSALMGLTETGTVLSTDGNLSDWRNVKELHFCYGGIVGITEDGRVLTDGSWEDEASRTALANMTGVETLVYSDVQGTFGCLKKDGSVHLISEFGYTDPYEVYWSNVKEVRDSGHAFYVIKKDGSVDGNLLETYAGLRDAVKVVDYGDWIFGISADGRLLTHNSGNISPNFGDLMVVAPEEAYYYPEVVDIRRFDQLKDIVPFCGLILLNKDGTIESISESPAWDFRNWYDIQKVCGTSDADFEKLTLYGIRQDGSVIISESGWDQMGPAKSVDQYRGWKLQDIYVATGGAVGLTTDGKLVGDGIYENLDFSVFER